MQELDSRNEVEPKIYKFIHTSLFLHDMNHTDILRNQREGAGFHEARQEQINLKIRFQLQFNSIRLLSSLQ
jgi:hypothetical protein